MIYWKPLVQGCSAIWGYVQAFVANERDRYTAYGNVADGWEAKDVKTGHGKYSGLGIASALPQFSHRYKLCQRPGLVSSSLAGRHRSELINTIGLKRLIELSAVETMVWADVLSSEEA